MLTPKVLYVGLAGSRVAWYRAVLPAMFTGKDWACVFGTPPGLGLQSSWVNNSTVEPVFADYDVIVLQQVAGHKWMELIKKLQSQGIKVIYELDDYVHGIPKLTDHDFHGYYNKDHLKNMRLCYRACDGMIVSTEYLREKYEDQVRNIWVCQNGLDMGRYRLSRPPRATINGKESVNLMWSGATGHTNAIAPWMVAISRTLADYPHTTFTSIGQPFAEVYKESYPDRSLSIPFAALETYPAAMMIGDIALAPASTSEWARAKSDLRVMEAQALGIPVIANRHYERSVIDGETGFIVDTLNDIIQKTQVLVEDKELREEMSLKAKALAIDHFDMRLRAGQWAKVHAEVLDLPAVR